MAVAVVCRQCGAPEPLDLGPIPRGLSFAGKPLLPPWEGGHLYRCTVCHLAFRNPLRSERFYEQMYASVPDQVWVSTSLRRDQQVVLDCISRRVKKGRVLDVGCYDGALLGALGEQYEKYGIEASTAAARGAEERGIRIVGSRVRDLKTLEEQFDVICAVDVIEHLVNPAAFLRDALERLANDGVIVVSSGDVDSRAWRAFGSRFYYCSYADHVSFCSQAWARCVAKDLDMALLDTLFLRHDLVGTTALDWLKRGALLTAMLMVSFVEMNLVRRFSRRARALGPKIPLGMPGLFKDHVVFVFGKGSR